MGGATVAQEKPGQRFTTRTDVVTLDVSALDRNRQPVRGLQASDFTILEDGKAQAVEYFDAIDLPDAPAPLAAKWRGIAPDVARNTELSERRLVVILIDDTMIPFDGQFLRSSREIARNVVDRLGPADLAAVVFSRDNRRAQNFTTDRARLLTAIDGFESAGYIPPQPGEPSLNDMEQFWTDSLQSLFRVVDTLATLPDRRKTLVHISIGIPLRIDTPETALSAHPYLNWLAKQTMRRALWGNVVIYPVDPGGLDGLRFYLLRKNRRTEPFVIEEIESVPNRYRDYLQALGDQTGGHAHINTNEFVSRIDQVFRETGSFYLLGYRPQNQRADGRFRRLQVKVNRPGVTVRTRDGYFEPKPPPRGMALPAATDAAISALVPKTDMPLELTAAPFALAGRREAAVIVTLGARKSSSGGGEDSTNVDVLLRAFTALGEDHGSMRIKAKVSTAENVPYEVLGRLDLAPGRYELRVSASAATSGSVYGYVDVPEFSREPLSMSGLVLGTTPTTPAGNTAAISDLLPFAPTTRRAFTTSDAVTAFVRVYASSAPAEIATVVRVIDANDMVVFEEPRKVTSESIAGADVPATLPIDRLRPGRFLLTVEATAGRHSTRRAILFEVR